MSEFRCHFYIMSFNRGAHLRVCVDSARRHLPGMPITVLDDGSTDPATLAVLDQLPVEVQRADAAQRGRHGGLYANMNRAIAQCRMPYLMWLQDDMQVVRDMAPADWAGLQAWFDADERHAFAHVCFPMGKAKLKARAQYKPWSPYRGYENDSGAADQRQRSRRWVYDVAMAHRGRLRAAGFSFGPTERANSARAADLFAPMLHFAEPFACQLPQVGALRFGRRTLAERLAERLAGGEPKCFEPLSADDVARLKSRPLGDILMADDILQPVDPGVKRPYVHKGVNARWYTRGLNKLELLIRR